MRLTAFLLGGAVLIGCLTASQAQQFLVWDLDLNHNSGPVISSTLVNAGYNGDYTTDINPYLTSLNNYRAIFICLGVYPDAVWLGAPHLAEEVDSLISYLINYPGTSIYMEGGDTWSLDPPTALRSFFNIEGLADGSGDTGPVLGRAGTFTQGMSFSYSGDNAFMDRIGPLNTAWVIFTNQGPPYNSGVAYDGGTSYRTIGASFEFGGLDDDIPPSTKLALADSIMHFFGAFHYQHDVGPVSIDCPSSELCPDEPLLPRATVMNWGSNAALNFLVSCSIDSQGVLVYSDNSTVSNLPPDETVQVSFSQWTPDGPGNCYLVTVYTTYAPDTNYVNDTLSVKACVFGFGDSLDAAAFPGLGAQALAGITYCSRDNHFYFVNKNDRWVYRLNPDDWSIGQRFQTANPGTEMPWGIGWDGEYFWVSAIGPAYSYDRQYTYAGTHTGYYIEMRAAIGCDWAAGMDFDRRSTRQVSFGGTGAIYRLNLLDPADPVLDSIQGPWSSGTERACCYVPYTHEIMTGGMNSGNLYKIHAANGAIAEQVSFSFLADLDLFDLGIAGVDTLHALVTLEDAQNTILKIALGLRRPLHDFAAISIDSPSADTVYDLIPIEATVANWGKQPQTGVWVTCSATAEDSIQPEWMDSLQISLGPAQEGQATFGAWMPRQKEVYYQIEVETHLSHDEIPYNNGITKTVYSLIPIHDGGVLYIFAPPDTVYCDSTFLPIIAVKNFGEVVETFDVICAIDSYADTAQVSNLPPDGSNLVTFAPWTAPSTDSTHCLMTVTTLVPGDHNPSNDTLSKLISVRCARHDGGVDSILSPPDSVSLGGIYPVSAIVRNCGTVMEDSFEVRCSINGHGDSIWVHGLLPGCAVQADFPDSFHVAGPGPWQMSVFTLVPGDSNPGNDTLSKIICLTGIEELFRPLIPAAFELSQNKPNPFCRTTTIRYSLPAGRGDGETRGGGDSSTCQRINISIHDLTGRVVRTLVSGEQGPGFYSVTWDGMDGWGRRLASGIYFCRMQAADPASPASGAFIQSRKLTLLR